MARQLGTKSIGRALSEFYGAKVKAYDYATKKGRVYVFKVFDSKGEILKAHGSGAEPRIMDIRLSEADYNKLIYRAGSELPGMAFKQAREFMSNRAVVNALWWVSPQGREEQRQRAAMNFKQALFYRYGEMTSERAELVSQLYAYMEEHGLVQRFWEENYPLIEEVFRYRDEKGDLLRDETYTDSNAMADMLIDRMSQYVPEEYFSAMSQSTGYVRSAEEMSIRRRQASLLSFQGTSR